MIMPVGFNRQAQAQSVVEFVLVQPLLLFTAIGIVDFGHAYRNHQTLNNAVDEAARNQAVHKLTALETEMTQAIDLVKNCVADVTLCPKVQHVLRILIKGEAHTNPNGTEHLNLFEGARETWQELHANYKLAQEILAGNVVAENCTDGTDNDGDQLVDCADPDCTRDPSCAPCDNPNGCPQPTP